MMQLTAPNTYAKLLPTSEVQVRSSDAYDAANMSCIIYITF